MANTSYSGPPSDLHELACRVPRYLYVVSLRYITIKQWLEVPLTHPAFLMPQKTGRTWWRNEFYDHPGRAERCDDAYVIATGGTTRVEKVYCIPCFITDTAEIVARDQTDVGLGRRNDIRSREEIITHRMSGLILYIAILLTAIWN
jgi:hypothetical protein